MSDLAIEIKNLNKVYKSSKAPDKEALKSINLEVKKAKKALKFYPNNLTYYNDSYDLTGNFSHLVSPHYITPNNLTYYNSEPTLWFKATLSWFILI